MKLQRLAMGVVILLAAAGGTGCVMVSTVQPLYTEKDRVTDPALEGVWIPVLHNIGVIDKMEVTRDKENRYSLAPAADAVYPPGGGKPPQIVDEAVIFKLGPHYVMEMGHLGFPGDAKSKREDRYFGKIAMIDGRIFVGMPDGSLIEGYLRANPTALKHRITEGGGGNPGSVTLLDSTENERAFFLKYSVHAFTYPLEAYRRPKGAKVAASVQLQTKAQESFEVIWLLYTQLRAIGKEGALASVRIGAKEPGDAEDAVDEPDNIELLPLLNLPESACDARVAKLYGEVRGALVAVRRSGAKIAEPIPHEPDPEKAKADSQKHVDALNAAERDPLGYLAGQLPKDHPQRAVLEKLSKTLDELTAETEKTYEVKIRTGK